MEQGLITITLGAVAACYARDRADARLELDLFDRIPIDGGSVTLHPLEAADLREWCRSFRERFLDTGNNTHTLETQEEFRLGSLEVERAITAALNAEAGA